MFLICLEIVDLSLWKSSAIWSSDSHTVSSSKVVSILVKPFFGCVHNYAWSSHIISPPVLVYYFSSPCSYIHCTDSCIALWRAEFHVWPCGSKCFAAVFTYLQRGLFICKHKRKHHLHIVRIPWRFILSVVAVHQRYFNYNKHMFAFQGGGEIIMEQTASKERAMSSFTKRKGQTTYKVNVFFAENTTATLPYVLSA